MTTGPKSRQRGAALIEFALVLIPLFMMIFGIIGMALTMWTYHTLAFAVREGARYAATKGQNCSTSGNSCTVTVANVAQRIAAAGIGLDPDQLNIALASAAGTINCNPLRNCYSNTAAWPPAAANVAGTNYISISGAYPAQIPIIMLFMPSAQSGSSLMLPASCRQPIQF